MVALSAAVGSVPSLMAVRNEGGVRRSSPSAGANRAKMLSEAPTGVSAYFAWMSEISR